jgi:brefeldin A-inhibited guanine nucleotide-exchange protein 3
MRALLGTEPEGSCFHQSLFTAYQTILCEVCSAETQEQIVGNLANFIEDAPHQIGSGWKPLFGALKAIRISPAKQKTS